MQNELVYPNNGDCLGSSIASSPFVPPERRALSPLYPNNNVDLPYPYSIFSPQEVTPSLVTPPLSASGSVSISPSSVSFDEMEDATAAADNRLYLARLALQYQEIAERYDMCLSNLRDAEEEAESLRRENASLRAANGELARRLGLLAGKHAGSVPSSAAFALADELSRLSIAKQPPPKESPTSVLAFQEGSGGSHRFARQSAAEKRVTLPKSISVRSSGYLKLNPTSGGGPTAKRNGRFRASSPVMGGSQRVYVGGASSNKKGERGEDEEKEGGDGGLGGGGALEVEVYHQGMFKTELCNKWEESGVCPYGDQCQFAHGIAELRPVLRHPRYKTELCRMVLFGDSCPYGHRCHFRHSLSPSDHQRLLLRP